MKDCASLQALIQRQRSTAAMYLFLLRLSRYAFPFIWLTACQLQKDGMAIFDARKAHHVTDAKTAEKDVGSFKDATTILTSDTRRSDSTELDSQSPSDGGSSSFDSSWVTPNLEGSQSAPDGLESKNDSANGLPPLLTDTALSAPIPGFDASSGDLLAIDAALDSATFEAASADSSMPALTICDWRLDNTSTLGDLPLIEFNKPSVIQIPSGPSLCFDGKRDGLIRSSNPLTGLNTFTVQVLLRNDQSDIEETHLLHIEEPQNIRHRFLLESRSTKAGTWYPRVFMRWDDNASELDNPSASLVRGVWYWVAVSYDGTTARLFVNGVETAAKPASFGPMGEAPLAIGMRLNKYGYYQGCQAQLIVSSIALPTTALRMP